MLLHVSGASGVGKSRARVGASQLLGAEFDHAELYILGPIPAVPTVAWRQEQTEVAVRRAIELQSEDRHLLFAGDPIPAGEVLAAPSADAIDVAVLLLDADPAAQNARLDERHDPLEWREANLGFAEWMRRHATDPAHLTEVVTTDAWPEMRWERWIGNPAAARHWAMEVLDTSAMPPDAVAASVADWARRAVRGEAPVFRAGWFVAG
jgi:hypothetical protein